MVIEVKEGQPRKTRCPILVTLLGIVIEVKEEHLEKAYSAIIRVPFLIV